MAARYTWDNILEMLLEKICLAGGRQRVHPFQSRRTNPPQPVLGADLRDLVRLQVEVALPA